MIYMTVSIFDNKSLNVKYFNFISQYNQSENETASNSPEFVTLTAYLKFMSAFRKLSD
jgi:hypothetical protein